MKIAELKQICSRPDVVEVCIIFLSICLTFLISIILHYHDVHYFHVFCLDYVLLLRDLGWLRCYDGHI